MLRFSLAAAAVLLSTSAFAHASITPDSAANGVAVKVAIAVPHGCDGAPTDKVTVVIPEGFVSAKPQVKAGWQIEVTQGDYAGSYELHGKPVTKGAVSVTWSGGSIPDDQFDEFLLQGTVSAEAPLAFVTTQYCGTASVAWDELAAEGQDPHALKHPAPVLTIAAAGGGHDMHDMGAMDMGSMPMPGAPVTVGDLTITGAFTRATLPNAPVGGGFLTIVNSGSEADRLIAAATPMAGEVQLHEMKMEGDVMKMAQLPDGIEIPAGATVTLAPGGLHLMFMQLTGPLVEGTRFPVTLTFEKAGILEVEVEVGGIGAKEPAMDHSMHGDATEDAHHDHASHMAMDIAGLSDVDAIAAMQKAMFDKPNSPLTMGPIVVAGAYAVSDWAQNGTGGRALLRKTDTGWAIHLCSGDALKDAAALAGMGVPEAEANQIADGLAAAEAKLDPALVGQFAAFDGVMMIDESLM